MATPSTTTTNTPIRLAILDDYTSSSTPHFSALASPQIVIDNVPHTKQTASDLQSQIDRLKPYTIISSMRERTAFPRSLLSALPNLKLLMTTGLYCAAIDLDAAADLGITVTGTKGRFPDSTGEQTWALILAVARRIAEGDMSVKFGGKETGAKQTDVDVDAINTGVTGWQQGTAIRMKGKTLGILGLGRLGTAVAVTGKLGFGMNVTAWSTNLTQEKADQISLERGLGDGGIKVVSSKEEFFKEADVVSVHYTLSERSRGIIGEEELGWMKEDAILVNTSRGPLIDETALVDVLRAGRIRGVGLDVFDVEPLPADSVWRDPAWGGRVVLSPHMGYVERDMMDDWYAQQADIVRRWMKGEEVSPLLKKKPGT